MHTCLLLVYGWQVAVIMMETGLKSIRIQYTIHGYIQYNIQDISIHMLITYNNFLFIHGLNVWPPE